MGSERFRLAPSPRSAPARSAAATPGWNFTISSPGTYAARGEPRSSAADVVEGSTAAPRSAAIKSRLTP
jgi:hypothetical protein